MANGKATAAQENEANGKPATDVVNFSVRLVWFGDTRLVCDPVHFPCLAAIVGERLLEVWSRIHTRPAEADENRLVVDRIHRKKFADSILEFANLRRIEHADLYIRPIETPLMRSRIVRPQCQPFDLSRRTTITKELIDLRPVVNRPADTGSLVIHPGVGTGERIQTATQMVFPGTEKRIEVVRTVPLCG